MYGYNIFHEEQMFSIIKSVQEGKNSHAYIFCGEKGLKKHVCAQMLANALVCANRSQAPCSSCPECLRSKAKTHPDISLITAPADRKTIGVEAMRSLSDDCFIKPFSVGHKVYIIEGDLLTESAQNAFLKTLEEPPEYAVFIIICTDLSMLLQTVISRCTIINFPPLSSEKLRKIILENYPNEKRVNFLINYAEGNPGKIDEIIHDEKFEELRFAALENLSMVLSDRLFSSYKVADFLEANKDNASEILNLWILFLRDVLLLSEGLDSRVVNSDLKSKLSVLVSRHDAKKITAAMKYIAKSLQMLARFVNLRAIALNLCLSVKTH